MKKSLQKKRLKRGVNPPSDDVVRAREELVGAWIASAEAKPKTPQYENNFWANERMDNLTCTDAESAEEAWAVILLILERPLADKALGLLAAGPVEDLLGHHGAAFIERAEIEARRNAVFRRTLTGVWRNAMSDAIWKRVSVAVRGA